MLPDDVLAEVERGLDTRVRQVNELGGGCIARASRVETTDGPVFLKWGKSDVGRAFPAEAAGLEALRDARSGLVVPQPLFVRESASESTGVLVLEWIEPGPKGEDFWGRFGRGLARLHRVRRDDAARRYGFGMDNFIGKLPQANSWRSTWPDFFAEMRLEPQVRRARDVGRWDASWTPHVDRLLAALESILPPHPEASLLHGDLWGGNFVSSTRGPALIDPAAYFGDRETDLAMTELFGGFDARFYAAYRDEWSIDAGYDERREVYNLYHLINHLNHFGSGYAGSVAAILRKY